MRAKSSLVRFPTLLSLALMAALAALALPAHSAEWTDYRDGPQRPSATTEAFSPTLSLVWKFTTEPSSKRVPPVVTNDRVFVAGGSSMYCLDVASGGQIWRSDAGSMIQCPPVYADNRVFFGVEDGRIIALSAADGRKLWEVETARSVRGAPAVVNGVVYAVSLDRQVLALDAATGRERWVARLTDELAGAPAIHGGMLYQCSADAQVFGVDTANGRIRLQATLPRRRALLHSTVVGDDAVFIAGRSDLRALSLRGLERWSVELGTYLAGAPAFANERLYATLINGDLVALDARKGTKLWEYHFKAPMSSSPTVVGSVVIAGAVGGTVYAFDTATGAIRWRYLARPPGLAAGVNASYDLVAPPVYSNGSLYLMWDDGTLARFDAKWPDPNPPTIDMLTPVPNRITGTTPPKVFGARVFDEESGVDLSSLELALDGAKVEATFDPYTGYLTYTMQRESPAPGWHTATVTARDQRGNSTTKSWQFLAIPGGESMQEAAPGTAPGVAPAPPPTVAPPPAQPGGFGLRPERRED